MVLGIGLNVTLRADELPEHPTGLPATSLRLAGAEVTDRDPLLRAILRGLATWYDRWRSADGDAAASGLRGAYLSRCATVGRDGAGAAARRGRVHRHRDRRRRQRPTDRAYPAKATGPSPRATSCTCADTRQRPGLRGGRARQ